MKPTTIQEYIDAVADDRKQIVTDIYKTIKKNLPKGFTDCINYGMIGFVVPHSIYKDGYHCDPKLPLPFISLASTKSHIAIYHMGMYMNSSLLEWFKEEWAKQSTKKLDMGKSCIRFKKPEDVPLKLIAEMAKKMSVENWIENYETVLKSK